MSLDTANTWGAAEADLVAAYGEECIAERAFRGTIANPKPTNPITIDQAQVLRNLAIARDEINGLMWRCFGHLAEMPCDGFIIGLHTDLAYYYLSQDCVACQTESEMKKLEALKKRIDARLKKLSDGTTCIGGQTPKCKAPGKDCGPILVCAPQKTFTQDSFHDYDGLINANDRGNAQGICTTCGLTQCRCN